MSTVTIKGKTYNLPPLNTGQIRRNAGPLLANIRALASSSNELDAIAQVPEIIGQHADLLHMALMNEYPHIPLEDVETMLFADLQAGVQELIKVSGLMGTAQGEVKAPAKRKR
jgi:hypothetical protein